MIADTGATINCQRTHDNCYRVKSANVPVKLAAAGSDFRVQQAGQASVVVIDDTGKAHVLKMGKTLIDPSFTNLLSPSAMFNNSDDVYSVVLNRHDSHFQLFNGKKIPLRWDGRLFYLDYLHPTQRDQTRTPTSEQNNPAFRIAGFY